ncbi:Golgin imh1, partial [Cryomyces antarcticus]
KLEGSATSETPTSERAVTEKDDLFGEQTVEAKPEPELPTDVRTKLRRLEKLEVKYNGLLRSYRIAHARISAIEPFEASLRENTPLTSINDPGAFVEYLNQINLKSDMVMDELKRVSADRDAYKSKLELAEKQAREAWDEVAGLRKVRDEARQQKAERTEGDENQELEGRNPAEPVLDPFGATDTKPSPGNEGAPPPNQSNGESEDLFSYDSEIPRLEGELKQRYGQIAELTTENRTLKDNLAAAKESAENITQSLETANKDHQALQELKERSEMDLLERIKSLEVSTTELKSRLQTTEVELQTERDGSKKHEEAVADLTAKHRTVTQELKELRSPTKEDHKSDEKE